jgi:stage V sporulation protein G
LHYKTSEYFLIQAGFKIQIIEYFLDYIKHLPGKVVLLVRVTDVRIRKLNQEGKMRAIVSVTLNDQFVVHDVRVIEGNTGLFVAMPSKRTPTGEFKDIAHPINSESRQAIQEAILNAYHREMEKESIKT